MEEYLVDLKREAGCNPSGVSPRTAEVQGSRLLSYAKVQRAFTARMAERSKRTEVTADRALVEIARLAFSDLRRLFHKNGRLKHPNEWDDDTAAAIASVEIVTRNRADGEVEHVHRIKLWDKARALEQLCKHLGLYQNQKPLEQPDHSPVSDLTDEELYQWILDAKAQLDRAIQLEEGMRRQTRLLEGSKRTPSDE